MIWDTKDSRHDVKERDDVANYDRMFFHLHRNLIKRRGSGNRWHLRPDRLVTADFETTLSCLRSDGTWEKDPQEVLGEEFRWIIPEVATLKEVDSAKTPFVQLADLMAGMAAYTRTKPNVVRMLRARSEGQQELFPEDHAGESSPNRAVKT